MGAHYSPDYHRSISRAGEGNAEDRWRSQRKLILRFKQAGTLLDIGCSSGAFLSTMRCSDWKLYGIEMEPSTAAKANTRSGADVFVGEALQAPFPPSTFDVITCFDLIEHVYSPAKLLERTLQWLKPEGILYMMLPNLDSWEARTFRSHWYGLELPRHLFHFSPQSLKGLATSIGFEQAYLQTPPISYLERSADYVMSSLMTKIGLSPTAQSEKREPSLPWRVTRKALRLTVIAGAAHLASLAGVGPSIEAVFRKPK